MREAQEGNRSAFSKVLQAEEVSTVERKRLGYAQAQVAIVLETVIATGPMFPKWNVRTAARKSELFEQIAQAFC